MPATSPAPNRSMTATEWGMLIALSLLWGGSFFFNGLAVRELPTFTVVVLRVGFGALVLLMVLSVRGLRLPAEGRVWRAFFGMGLLNNVIPFSLIVWGQTYVASGVASILNATTPLFTVVVAHLLTADEKMTGGRMFGVLVGFSGVVVMIGGAAVHHGAGLEAIAPLTFLGAALSYALSSVYGRRFNAWGLSPMTAATGQVCGSSLILLPVALLVDQPWTLPMPGPATWGAVAGLAILSTAVAYILFFRILGSAGATNIMLVTFLVPVSAILLGIAFLGETLLPRHVAGMALIGLGLAAIDGRLWRYVAGRRRKTEP